MKGRWQPCQNRNSDLKYLAPCPAPLRSWHLIPWVEFSDNWVTVLLFASSGHASLSSSRLEFSGLSLLHTGPAMPGSQPDKYPSQAPHSLLSKKTGFTPLLPTRKGQKGQFLRSCHTPGWAGFLWYQHYSVRHTTDLPEWKHSAEPPNQDW